MSSKRRKFNIIIVSKEIAKASVMEKNALLFALLKDLIIVDKKKEYLKTIDKVLVKPENFVNKYYKDIEDLELKQKVIKMIKELQI